MTRDPSIPPLHALSIAVICFVLALICMAVIFGGCASSRAGKLGDLAVIGSGIADVVSTQPAIARGGREGNPLVGQSPWRQWAVKSAGIGGVLAGAAWLERKDHTVTAWIIRATAIGLWTAATISNTRSGR